MQMYTLFSSRNLWTALKFVSLMFTLQCGARARKRLRHGTRLTLHTHHNWSDRNERVMCLFLFLFGADVSAVAHFGWMCHFDGEGNRQHNTSFTFYVIDCFDCENWHRQLINFESQHIDPLLCASLSFVRLVDANESNQTADSLFRRKQRARVYANRCCSRKN